MDDGTVIIRSHGVTPDVHEAVMAKGLPVIDATCPHVGRAQKAAAELARKGCRVIVVGEEGHPEVEGLKAYAHREGLKVDVVPSPDDVPQDLRFKTIDIIRMGGLKCSCLVSAKYLDGLFDGLAVCDLRLDQFDRRAVAGL